MANTLRLHSEHILSATRLHLPPDATEIPEATKEHLKAYVANAQSLGIAAAIAVNSHEEEVRMVAKEVAPEFPLQVLHVPYWGTFVPALNALLDFAQRSGMTHILYQSLEVQCTQPVLQHLLKHFNPRVLVVGPELAGHTYQCGEQPLNGRTTPWNTLALWSVRKLALTGFLRIADGFSQSISNAELAPQQVADASSDSDKKVGLVGSSTWWNRQVSGGDGEKDVPAGVEEVTAIALLQHLLGRDNAVSVLLRLPQHLAEGQVCWKANWGQDEKRKQWHEYKMKSKVTRPHAQLQELFNLKSPLKSKDSLATPGAYAELKTDPETGDVDTPTRFGTVMHFGSSISPSHQTERICLTAVGIFYFNSTAVLASAFGYINSTLQQTSTIPMSMMIFMGCILGGVYILMPISLQITRMLTYRFSHMCGFIFFGVTLFLSHMAVIASQLTCDKSNQNMVLLTARLVQGLGSGVLFQSRFVLAALSTSDHHTSLQACSFMACDLGLGLGALLPAGISCVLGLMEQDSLEMWTSIVLAMVCFGFLAWVLLAFPRHLHFLPDRVRFPEKYEAALAQAKDDNGGDARCFRWILLVSGTLRVFVQSAIIPVVAILMYEYQWTGQFRQSIVVATLYLMQLPFEAMANRLCSMTRCTQASISLRGKLLWGVALVTTCTLIFSLMYTAEENLQSFLRRLFELVAIMVMLAIAAPVNSSRLHQLPDAECVIVTLEWMKAYIGRLLGPFVAILMYTTVGYRPLVSCLHFAALVVALTAQRHSTAETVAHIGFPLSEIFGMWC